MRKHRILNILLTAVLTAVTLMSCEHKEVKADGVNADSLIEVAHKRHQYDRLLELADTLQASGHITSIHANYWRGYSYSRQRMMGLSEKYWKQAVNSEIHNQEDLKYYAKSANRLSGDLLLKGEYEATMKVAVPAMEKMAEANYQTNSDYAYLKAAVGCCQLRMGSPDEAIENFNQAYNLFYDVVEEDPVRANFRTAIAGIITITEAYIQTNHFREAYEWAEKFGKFLDYYKQTSNPEPDFVDKQQARLNIYSACALEGLGQHAEAQEAYDEAMKSDYAQTGEGSTNFLLVNCQDLEGNALIDARVRKALSLCIDREYLCSVLLNGTKQPAVAYVGNGFSGSSAGVDFRGEGGEMIYTDVEEAKKLMAEAGYPDGAGFPVLTCSYANSSADYTIIFEYLQAVWEEELGITVQLEPLDKSVMTEYRDAGKFDITPQGWGADYMDASNMLSIFVTGNFINGGRYSSEVFDNCYYQSLKTVDQAARMELLHTAEAQLLTEDMGIIPLYHGSAVAIYSDDVLDNVIIGASGKPMLELVVHK